MDYHNQFLLFGGDDFYPSGGWDDFICDQPTLSDAITTASQIDGKDWFHVVNLKTNKIEWKSHRGSMDFPKN
jgi:hypothetical protein